MSLINQALKKEQRRRSLNFRDSTPDIPSYDSENTGNGLSASSPKNSRSLSILLGFTGMGLVLLVLGGGFIYFGKSYLNQLTSPQMVSKSENSASFATGPETAPITTVTQILDEIEVEGPRPEIDAETQKRGIATENLGSSIQEEPVDEETIAVEENPEPEFDFKIQDLIDEMQVLGFRSAGPNSRLLMNGRVFKLEDIVDNERGIRFLGSDGQNLVFETPSGYRYRKPL